MFKKKIGGKALALSVDSRIKKLSKAHKEDLIERDHMIDEIIARTRKDAAMPTRSSSHHDHSN